MSTNNIEKAIVKYLSEAADLDDLDALSKWIQIPKNQMVFEDYVKIHYKINLAMSNLDIDQIKKNLLEKIKKDQNELHRIKTRKVVFKYAAAAILVITLASTYFLRDTIFSSQQDNAPIIVNNNILPGTEKAILTLETGEAIILEKGTTYQTQNATSNGETIKYSQLETRNLKPKTNTLTIPRGGQFQITLADGTKVWLNSETQLKYPEAFVDGQPREVELVYGEAYFEVSHSTEHKGSYFKVLNNNQEVEVLGTEFNIKAYKNETNIYTTLVEGKVALSSANINRVLVPGEQSNLNTLNDNITINKVDVYNQISWKEGVFSFENMELSEVMKVMARWYNMEISIENKEIEHLRFTGGIQKSQRIVSILNIICNNVNNVSYEIHDKKVTLKAY